MKEYAELLISMSTDYLMGNITEWILVEEYN
jgi:hypothetical protein